MDMRRVASLPNEHKLMSLRKKSIRISFEYRTNHNQDNDLNNNNKKQPKRLSKNLIAMVIYFIVFNLVSKS